MSYLGPGLSKSSDIRRFNVTSSTSATHTLSWTPPNEQSLIVTINGVKQQEDAYSVSGTTLTLTSALVATDKMEVIGINDLGTTITPAQNSINNSMLQDSAITNAKVDASAAIADTKISLGTAIQAYDADTAKTDVAQTFTAAQRGEITTLTSAASVTIDMADSNNFTCTMGHNITFANPTNLTAGQSGSIFLVQDGTGSRTGSWGSYWDFAGGTAPTLTTTAAAVDRIDYVVRSSTSIHAVATLNLS